MQGQLDDETGNPAASAVRSATVRIAEMPVARFRGTGSDPAPVSLGKRADAFCVIVQRLGADRSILRKDDEVFFEGPTPRGHLGIFDMREDWRCHHLSDFDSVCFQIPFARLRVFAEKAGRPELTGLSCAEGTTDDVVLGLAQALLPALDDPKQASQLFLDQIGLALLAHLTQAYGGLHFPVRRKGTLAPWQEKRATEFLSAHVSASFSIADLAEACNLSRSYFIKAFKETFGKTPYRWLMDFRLSKAKEMLRSDAPIADIAVACGFSDQSHFTRVFCESTGNPPGNWRRHNRSGYEPASRI
ncbi:AraC family transcriptional regulator [Rhizobium sp. S95]|uniref:AraC family transcriptional regulator n=1 Tax=Ciceribacter sichuanensis TaxID=2949647 RepID=A0AAJ1BZ95_9HYPH|nr:MULTISPECIES: AraC family transcriptional regulator [unclassified Ciceribacter]MCM2397326.1 AraC family transcriptional regulator [Ciceribacter sp. S95]MCM2403195.1 AraC family transcriptional regulator [Ciceribacter sp. S153]MCO5959024.1 AraC family transcriptional regulator [Ciceribacter sp. S101]